MIDIKKKRKKVIVILLAAVITLSAIIGVFAVSGSYSGGGVGTTIPNVTGASGGFNIKHVDPSTYRNIVGYRVSAYNENDAKIGITVDIIGDGWNSYFSGDAETAYKNFRGAAGQQTKQKYRTWDFEFNTNTKISGLSYNIVSISSNAGLSGMPQDPTGNNLKNWIEADAGAGYKHNDILYLVCNVQEIKHNYKLLVEPIIQCNLAETDGGSGIPHALTVTELAVYGGLTIGFDEYKSADDDGKTIKFLNNYICRAFPNLQHLPWGTTLLGMRGGNNLSSNATYRTIVNDGYGAGVFVAVIPYKTLNIYGLGDSSQPATFTYPAGGTEYISSNGNATYTNEQILTDSTITLPTFKRSQWIFGYATTDNTTANNNFAKPGEGKPNESFSLNQNTNVYAVWAPYTVDFYLNYGSSASEKYTSQTWNYSNGNSNTAPRSYIDSTEFPVLERDEYIFYGWTTAVNKDKNYKSFTSITSADDYSQGMTWAYKGASMETNSRLAQNIRLFASPNQTNPTGVAPLYAIWKPYSVVFNANDGSAQPKQVTKEWAMSNNAYSSTELAFPDSEFSREGYTLVGWTTKANGKFAEIPSTEKLYELNTSIAANDDKASELRTSWANTNGVTNLYAVWAPND